MLTHSKSLPPLLTLPHTYTHIHAHARTQIRSIPPGGHWIDGCCRLVGAHVCLTVCSTLSPSPACLSACVRVCASLVAVFALLRFVVSPPLLECYLCVIRDGGSGSPRAKSSNRKDEKKLDNENTEPSPALRRRKANRRTRREAVRGKNPGAVARCSAIFVFSSRSSKSWALRVAYSAWQQPEELPALASADNFLT